MSHCPLCGKSNPLSSSRIGSGRCECDQGALDLFLEIGAAGDWITPASELTGVPKGVIIILALVIIVMILVTHGVLWG